MRRIIPILCLLISSQWAFSQTGDSIPRTGVEERAGIMIQHLEATFPDDSALTDTLEYFATTFARHIAIIQKRTYRESARKPQYEYALELRNRNYKRVMSADQWQAFIVSLGNGTPTGFAFCLVCRYALSPGTSCKNCGTPGRSHSE